MLETCQSCTVLAVSDRVLTPNTHDSSENEGELGSHQYHCVSCFGRYHASGLYLSYTDEQIV